MAFSNDAITLENIDRKDHEDGLTQTGCFCEVVDIAPVRSSVTCTVPEYYHLWIACANTAIHIEHHSARRKLYVRHGNESGKSGGHVCKKNKQEQGTMLIYSIEDYACILDSTL